MEETMSNKPEKEKSIEVKQTFLSNAISDISSYIHLADTKVSIIMAAVVAILVGILTCYQPITQLVANIKPCTWIGVLFIIFAIVGAIGIIAVFLFGILTIRNHSCYINYKSKWFLPKSPKEYSFDEYYKDVQKMSDEDVIKNMSAELYKLNDINRQKMRTAKWTLISCSVLLFAIFVIAILFLINSI